MGVDLLRKIHRIEVVVDEDLGAGVRQHAFAHRSDTFGVIEIRADEQIRGFNEPVAGLGFLLVDANGVSTRHPIEERREGVGHDDVYGPVLGVQIVVQRQRGTHGIAIRRHVGEDNDMMCGIN